MVAPKDDKELLPAVSERRANRCNDKYDCSDEDSTTAAEVVVQGVREPTATDKKDMLDFSE
jgi:hypothetical protein